MTEVTKEMKCGICAGSGKVADLSAGIYVSPWKDCEQCRGRGTVIVLIPYVKEG